MNELFFDKEDQKLIEGCLKGQSLAQEKLFKKYYGIMLGICLRYTNNRNEAKEVLQEGYIKVFNYLHTFHFDGSLSGWMKKIMVNTAIDKYRKRIAEPVSYDISEMATVENDIISDLNKNDLLECINCLPAGYKAVFNLYVIEGFNHREIAEQLGINEGTSKSQLAKAKQYLQYLISKRMGEQ
jgi:RNA polymerase sigma-70 factor (ECF subfamily)